MLDSFKNYYTILNVPEAASCDEIKAAFRRMAKLYVPRLRLAAMSSK